VLSSNTTLEASAAATSQQTQTLRKSQSAALGAGLLLYSSAQFFVLTTVAMVLYPGGAKFFRTADHYLFFQNFFSDLGASHSWSGQKNLPAEVLFIVALSCVGFALIGSSGAWKVIAPRERRKYSWAWAAQICAVLSGLCYIGIAATPWNLMIDLHNIFVKAAFSFLLGFIVCLSALQTQAGWPNHFLATNYVYLALLFVYVSILFFGPKLDHPNGLAFQVVAQKIIVYTSILNLAYQALGVRQATYVTEFAESK